METARCAIGVAPVVSSVSLTRRAFSVKHFPIVFNTALPSDPDYHLELAKGGTTKKSAFAT
jgi:hypothetical protein